MHRLRSLYIFCSILLCIIVLKLFSIQAFESDTYQDNNYLKTQRIEPARGTILDSKGSPFVLNTTQYRLIAQPHLIEDTHKTIRILDDLFQIGTATLEAKLDPKKKWVPIIDRLTLDQKKKVLSKELEGIIFEDQESRFYPESSLSAQLLGFVGLNDKGKNVGYFGLEGYYEKDLAGLPGLMKTERDVKGKPIIIGLQQMVQGENGRDLYLTIDKNIQKIAKTHLQKGIEKYGAVSGCVIIENPKTGQILAQSCLPDFDPTEYKKFSNDTFKNPVVSSLFEPGSIFKPLVMAAALNEGTIKMDDEYEENGPVELGGYTINNWDKKYVGTISMTEILEKSSNVGMVHVGASMKHSTFINYLKKYGFGEKTNIDLQGEAAGYIKPENKWYPIDYATASFGQGIAVSPIQMITAFSALVNGGWIMKPYVVSKITSEGGEEKHIEPKKVRQVLSKEASESIRAMLVQSVKHGEVKWKIPSGYKVGGKTGTAQIPIDGTYQPDKTIASFVGFAPVDDPSIIMLVTLREPSSSQWGSETAAPLFFDIFRELVVYLNMPPR